MLLAASDNTSASVRAKALHRAAEMDGYLGNFDRGIALGVETLELARAGGDKWNAAWLKPQMYAVNEDGDKPEKREFCEQHGLQYVVLKRAPKEGLPRRESTKLRGF